MQVFSKEIKYVEKYISNSNFYFLEADRTFIVYRSEVSGHTTSEYPKLVPTVDIVLVGGMYFELLSDFETIAISNANDKKSFELAEKFDKAFEWLKSTERVFKLESKNTETYTVTANIWILEYNCQYRRSFIENFNYEDFFNNFVDNWIKIK